MLDGKVCFSGAVFSRLESFQDDMNADLLADGLGGGPGMSTYLL